MALTRLQRKKAPVSSDRMTLLREMVESELHTRPTASNKLLPKLPEFPLRVDSDQLRRWYDCRMCNAYKGPNLTSIDLESQEVTLLYNPRTDIWDMHFVQVGIEIVGLTAIGRCTVELLHMNDEERLRVREAMLE